MGSMTLAETRKRPAMFQVNDLVVVVAPSGQYEATTGTVREIYVFGGMYRYVVEFEAGATAVFFGFELRCFPIGRLM